MHLIGIDAGSQSLKAVVVTGSLRIAGAASVAYRPSFPQPGWAEQDPALWLYALSEAIGRALAQAGVPASRVAALAITGQLDGCVPVDTAGQALGPCIMWMDRRATAEVEGIDARLIHTRTGLVPDATHMAAKIAWSLRHLPKAWDVACWHQPVSFLVESLTGERVMDPGLASTTMLHALGAAGWDPDLLDLFGIDGSRLPRLAPAEDVAGCLSAAGTVLTGLPAGLPIAVGTGDDFATLLAGGIATPGTVAVTVGTAEIVGALSEQPLIDREYLVETHDFLPGAFLIGNPGWLSGGAVAWGERLLGLDGPAAFSRLADEASPGCEGLTFLPALTGAMSPRWRAGARGAFYGFTPRHGPAHLARAVLEGTAFAMRDVVERLDALGVPIGNLRFMGGGARSAPWAHIRADATGRVVEVPEAGGGPALGAAVLASVAASAYPSLPDAVAALPLRLQPVEPDPRARLAYDEAYGRYRALFDCLEPLF